MGKNIFESDFDLLMTGCFISFRRKYGKTFDFLLFHRGVEGREKYFELNIIQHI